MKFGPVPTRDAAGAILAHSVQVGPQRLKKGKRLDAQDVAALCGAGLDEVTVARLEEGDVPEDDAAARLAAALVPYPEGVGLRIGAAATGRANIYAEAPGIVEVNVGRIGLVNGVHPAITVATVPPWQRTAPRQMIATVKIIAYAVPDAALRMACDVAHDGLSLRRPVRRRAVLIQTTVGSGGSGPGPDEGHTKGHAATGQRLDRFGVALAPPVIVPHRIAPLAQALADAAARADIVLILTGSATSDPFDTAPQALRAAGGVVHHFGMPVDPGNLLFHGELHRIPVIGLPGCARSLALNGADWVMERILCGVPVTPADIAGMGVGGLLKEIPQRGRLRDG